MSITPDFNKYPKIANFDEVIFIAQQAYELGFRGGTGEDLYAWLKSRLDLTGLSNTAGLPEDFPAPGSTLSATNKGEWTILTPGTYNKVGSGTIEVAEGEIAFAQFDGEDFNLVQRVDMPALRDSEIHASWVNSWFSSGAGRNYVFDENMKISSGEILWENGQYGDIDDVILDNQGRYKSLTFHRPEGDERSITYDITYSFGAVSKVDLTFNNY